MAMTYCLLACGGDTIYNGGGVVRALLSSTTDTHMVAWSHGHMCPACAGYNMITWINDTLILDFYFDFAQLCPM